MHEPLYGGIEAGGTKFVCALGTGPHDIRAEVRFPTTTPDETLDRTVAFFSDASRRFGPLAAIGVSCFGPLDPDRTSKTYGYITTTPKPGWKDTDVVGSLQRAFDVPVGFDTDVNGAALGECRWGAAQGLSTFVYMTVGTGIGGGGMAGGTPLHGLIHPEMGHLRVPHDWERDPYPGRCPYHGDCLEGLACGPAIEERWGRPAPELIDRPEVWNLEAEYLAYAMSAVVLIVSPQRLILGGGVMEVPDLIEKVREKTLEVLNGYVDHAALLERMDSFIVKPMLGARAGVAGAFALAMDAVVG